VSAPPPTRLTLSASPACRSFELDGIATITRGTLREWTTSQTSPQLRNYNGLDLEKTSRPPVEAELFLDIAFYRTH